MTWKLVKIEFPFGWAAKVVAQYLIKLGIFVVFDPQEDGSGILWLESKNNGDIGRFITEALELQTGEKWMEVVRDIRHHKDIELG